MKLKHILLIYCLLSTSCIHISNQPHNDIYFEIILKGDIREDSGCCRGGHAIIYLNYNNNNFIVSHSHGEAFKMEELIAGPADKNGVIIKDEAVLLDVNHEQLLLNRLKASEVYDECLIRAIKRFSVWIPSDNKANSADVKSRAAD